jgi:hypothetical protein
MLIDQAGQIIEGMLKNKVKVPFVLVGHRGIGKTEMVKTIAAKLETKAVILRLGSLQDVGDLMGNPYVLEKPDGTKETKYAKPWWVIELEQGALVLVLDEVNRAKPSLTDAIMQILDSRRFNEYVLPDNMIIVATMNPTSEEYDVSDFDAAVIDRGVFVKTTCNADSTINFMIEREYPEELIDLVSLSKEKLQYGEGFDMPVKAYANRGLAHYKAFYPVIKDLSEDAALELIQGCVGHVGVSVYRTKSILREIPSADEYFKNMDAHDVKEMDKQKLLVLINRIVVMFKNKKHNEDLKNKFTTFCSRLDETMILYIARITSQNAWMKKFIDTSNEALNKACTELAKILQKGA